MRPIGWSLATLTALGLGLAVSACGDARPAVGGGDGGGGTLCSGCHGTASRTGTLPGTDPDLAAAPPIAPAGEPAEVIGAHQAHLNPAATGSFTGPLACSECHVVPTDFAHATNPPASPVHFSAGTLATTGGAAAAWNSTDKTTNTTCSNVYCHGTFTYGAVTGKAATPNWAGSGLTCTSCHDLPPAGHIALPAPVTASSCNGCHPDTVDILGNIIVDAAGHSLHINGQKNVAAGSCTTCHGTAGRTGTLPGTDAKLAAAPPIAPAGEPAQVVGAHQAHLNPAATGSLTGPIACNECHAVPADSAHAGSPPASPVHFSAGTLATTGGAAAAWNSTDKTTNTTCSNVYCHGTFAFGSVTGTLANAPDWTGTNQAACGSCHQLPPVGHIANASIVADDPTTCSGCHPGTVATNGTIIVAAATGLSKHVNGQADEGAHADPSWLTASGGNHTSAALNQSPPFGSCLSCHVGFGAADPTDVAGSSCNACHSSRLTNAATTDWTMNCVFCHGDGTKLLTYTVADQTSDPWIIAPPTGVGGETLTTSLAVGAHQKHVNPASNALSSAFACSECHTPSLPSDIFQTLQGHLSADGSVPVLLAGTVATTGGVQGSWTSPTCSATYCHGNFTNGGNNAAPAWTGDATNSACTSCHGVTGDANGISPRTGRHPTNWAPHNFMGNQCQFCHSGIATAASATATPTIVSAGKSLHVNGQRNAIITGGTWTPNAGYGGTCAPACHGSETW